MCGQRLPWTSKEAPGDLNHFHEETTRIPGSVLVMGRKTYDSLPSTKLPGRQKVVITRNPRVIKTTEQTKFMTHYDALKLYNHTVLSESTSSTPWFLIGGKSIYELFMPQVTQMIVTRVNTSHTFKADVFLGPVVSEKILGATTSLSCEGHFRLYDQKRLCSKLDETQHQKSATMVFCTVNYYILTSSSRTH